MVAPAFPVFSQIQLTAVFPEFGWTSEAQVEAVQQFVGYMVDWDKFGGNAAKYTTALQLATAHHFAMSGQNGGRGPISGTKVGDMSKTYTPMTVTQYLENTTYGQRLLLIARGLPRRMYVEQGPGRLHPGNW